MNEKKSVFNVRNLVRMLSMFCIAFVFCPTFLVSCSGQTMEISGMDLITGISAYGQKSDSYPAMIISLLLPAAIIVVMFLKNTASKKIAAIMMGCSACDLALWMYVKSQFKKAADQYYCVFETTGWYNANMIALIFLILISILLLVGIARLDREIVSGSTKEGAKKALNHMAAAVSQTSGAVSKAAADAAGNVGNKASKEKTIGYCTKCGKPITSGSKFCTSCGAPVSDSLE